MSTPIIEVNDLSKRYRLGVFNARSAKEDFESFLRRLKLRAGYKEPPVRKTGDLWALRNLNFTVNPGEVIGIIGGNGAGKSTLLKILSRITEPTSGEAILRGRVGSLLEVGTGFHPDLTGRENIFLNATILGMRKEATRRCFGNIVEFAEVEEFIDTPVRRYSSGMRVRLAFAVAAFLEPEILIVDEVLAVGDESFQRKCIGKMSDVAKHGRTILFVSHDLAAVQHLCERAIGLRKGQMFAEGKPAHVIGEYLAALERDKSTLDEVDEYSGQGPRIVSLAISQGPGTVENLLMAGRPAHFAFELRGSVPTAGLTLEIYNDSGVLVSRLSSRNSELEVLSSELVLTCVMEQLLLAPGRYRLAVGVYVHDAQQRYYENIATIEVKSGTSNNRLLESDGAPALVELPHAWEAEHLCPQESIPV